MLDSIHVRRTQDAPPLASGAAQLPRLRRVLALARQHAPALAITTLLCWLTTAVAAWLLLAFDLSNVVMLFLIMVVFVALRLGRLAGAWASLVGVASFDFFFIEPRFTFAVTDTQYLFTFALMLAVALIVSQLAARLRAEAQTAREGERRASALVRVMRDLADALGVEQIAAVCRDTIAPLFGTECALLAPDAAGHLVLHGGRDLDLAPARRCFERGVPAGGAGAEASLYLPLQGPMAVRGVLVLQPGSGSLARAAQRRPLLDACCSALAQALERIHFAAAAQNTQVRIEGERMRNTLLSAVSHDLKTPLTAIRGLAETLEHPQDIDEPQRIDIARAIRLESDELQRLVSNLLDLARMQTEGVRLRMEWHAPSEIVGSALARCAAVLQPRTIVTDLPADLPLVELDALLIERVLTNLFDNAAKYTPPTATITVRGRRVDGTIRLRVEDDGPGLPGPNAERLFDAFMRGRKESSIAGVGLGLTLCRRIVDAHGGTIGARARVPNGVKFEIRLPWRPAPGIDNEVNDE
jgi:two-component system sensor histidine kinase KdpD